MTTYSRKPLRSNHLKEYNRRQVLLAIRQKSSSRAEIAADLGLSKPTVSTLVDELIREGLVRESGQGKSTVSGGKKPILLDFNHQAGLIATVYINGHIQEYEIALTNLEPQILCCEKFPIPQGGHEAAISGMISNLHRLVGSFRQKGDLAPIKACCVSISGLVDTGEGIVRYSSTLRDWVDVPLKKYFEEGLRIPVFVDNDGRAGAMAELLTRHWDKKRVLACVQIGRGIGTGVVIGNEVFRGSRDGAVTFSHTTIMPDGPLCTCGNRGCFETLASLDAFATELAKRDSSYGSLEPEAAVLRFLEGDPIVRDVLFNFTGYWLSVGLANLINIFNPDELIIQGPLAQAGQEFLDYLCERTLDRCLPGTRQVQFRFSVYDDLHVPIYGAAAIFIIQNYFHYGFFDHDD